MGLFHIYRLLADAPVDKNIAEGEVFQKSAVPRRVVRMGLGSTDAPSAAVPDAEVDVLFGTMKVAHLSSFGSDDIMTINQLYWHSSKLTLPPGVPINVIVTNAPSTGLDLYLDIQELSVR